MASIFDSLERAKQGREQHGKYKENLFGSEWFGVIVSVDDTKNFDGRCKVRVFEKFDDIVSNVYKIVDKISGFTERNKQNHFGKK